MLGYLNPLKYLGSNNTSVAVPTEEKQPPPDKEEPCILKQWVYGDRVIHIIHNYNAEVKLALLLQPLVRRWLVRKEMAKVKLLQKELTQIEEFYDKRLAELGNEILAESKKKREFETQKEELGTGLKEVKFKVKTFFAELKSNEEEKAEILTQNSPKEELELSISRCQSVLDTLGKQKQAILVEREGATGGVNKKICALVDKMLPKEKKVPVALDEPKKEVNHFEKMLADIEQHTHGDLRKLIEIIFGKVDGKVVKYWEYDPASAFGKFKIVLHQTIKLWIRPRYDDGKPDSRTPKGVVLIIGGQGHNVVTGTIGKGHQSINFEVGFQVFCQYSQNLYVKTIEGYADGRVECIQYEEGRGEVAIRTTSTARKVNITKTNTENSKFETLMKTWSEGKSFTGCHEEFLSKQSRI